MRIPHPLPFALVLVLLLGLSPSNVSAVELPTQWMAPANLSIGMSQGGPHALSLYFQTDAALVAFLMAAKTNPAEFNVDSVNATVQVDWRLDNGAWHYTTDWDRRGVSYGAYSGIYSDTGPLSGQPTDQCTIMDLRNDLGRFTSLQTQLGSALLRGTEIDGSDNRLNLLDHTFSFRLRFHVRYYDKVTLQEKYILSPWSEVLPFGKNASTLPKPAYLANPTLSAPTCQAGTTSQGGIQFHLITPQQVLEADAYIRAGGGEGLALETSIHIGEGDWVSEMAADWHTGLETLTVAIPDPSVDISAEPGTPFDPAKAYLQVRVRYLWAGGANLPALTSSWSNTLSLNAPAWNTASSWAMEEMRQADTLALIPEILTGTDSLAPITREEFCELAVRLYETKTGKTVLPAEPNPFRDTSNPQILKAITLGITVGVNRTTFQPGTHITREQSALMLYRTLHAIDPDTTPVLAETSGFRDEENISVWAREAVSHMSSARVILGNGSGLFMPRPTTESQRASGYGMATREAAILMVVRTYKLQN